MRSFPLASLPVLLSVLLTGCFSSSDEDSSSSASSCSGASAGDDDDDDDDDGHNRPKIQESDIYRIEGSRLFVYSYTKGLTVIDTSDAGAPSVTGEVALPSAAGELYVRESRVFVVTETSTECPYGRGEVVAIDATIAPPAITSRVCLAAAPIASRLVGNVLYAVSSNGVNSWVESVRVSDPSQIEVAAMLPFAGGSSEIHMTDAALWVAQPLHDTGDTRLQYVDVTDAGGALAERGAITISGFPQGRFHMEATGTQFRIVTFDWNASSSTLHVLDFSDPDAPSVMGALGGIAPGEGLHATRFVEDRAYVVTFLQTDPLWVIGLSDPTQPVILGELEIPGWSDFLFPRGNRLLAVGRGDGGSGVGVSLFDVTDPAAPASLGQLAFGDWASYSEANTDFRGVGVHDPEIGAGEGAPLLALPISGVDWNTGECRHTVQLVDVTADAIVARGQLEESAAVRRSTTVGGRLLAISDLHVSSIDVTNRDVPVSTASVSVGDAAFASEQCLYFDGDWGGDFEGTDCGGCSVTPFAPVSPRSLLASALAALALASAASLRGRRRHGR